MLCSFGISTEASAPAVLSLLLFLLFAFLLLIYILTPIAPPLIKDAPNSNQSVLKDGTISFTCVASGVPLPTISWYKDGSPLITDLEGHLEIIQTSVEGFSDFDNTVESVLTIHSVGVGDAGYYGCKGGSAAGETELTNQYHLILGPILMNPGGEYSVHNYLKLFS